MRPRSCVGIEVFEVLLPWAEQVLGRGLLDAVLDFLAVLVFGVAFVEEVVHAIFVDDVVVDAAVLGREQDLRLTLETCEILVGVCIVGDERLAVAALQGEVDHVLLRLAVVDGLRSPYPVGITEVLGIVLRQHHLAVCPVHQVAGLQHHDAWVGTPPLLRVEGMHIRCHKIVAAVLTAQDMRITDTTAFADAIRSDDGAVSVQRIPVLCVLAHREAQFLLLVTTSLEVSEEITGIGRLLRR